MKFSIGDPVFVKSNEEEGVIEEFIGKDMASVRVDGKTYYVYLTDLDHPYLRWFMKESSRQRKKTPYLDQLSTEKPSGQKQQALPEGVYLVYFPTYTLDEFDDKVEKVKVFLYNETKRSYRFSYQNVVRQKELFSLQSEILPAGQFYLHDVPFEEMAMNPVFTCRFTDLHDPKLENEYTITIKARKFFEKIDEIRFANRAFFHYMLFDQLVPKPREEVIVHQRVGHAKPISRPEGHFDFKHAFRKATKVVDLHIEALVPEPRLLAAGEILEIQLKACREALDLAYATHQHCLVIIHGIGKGVLKTQINALLSQTNGVVRYVNEYDSRYGYGATKVFFS